MDRNIFLIELSKSAAVAFGKVDFLEQSEKQKVFTAIWALESQVNDGGFLQYFSSWDGETANYAPSALRRIGAHACAAVVERALAAVSVEPLPPAREERQTLVENLGPETLQSLEEIDAEFLAYPDNLTELLFAFVSANPVAFGLVEK